MSRNFHDSNMKMMIWAVEKIKLGFKKYGGLINLTNLCYLDSENNNKRER
jgi:uncharacterized UBP type Zn finger protein